MNQLKPRFDRSQPRVLRAEDLRQGFKTQSRNLAPQQKITWRPISMETLGYLAATGKVNIIQVHSLIGDGPNKKFRKAFLDSVDLRQPSNKEMQQIGLFSHLLF